MHKLSLDKVLQFGTPDALVIRSLSCGIYRAEVTLAEQTYILADSAGVSKTFRSTQAIKEYCRKLDYKPAKAYLHQNTAYGEMIGLSESSPDDMLLPIPWVDE
ncbi:DUF6482 family protein [Halioxenophilus aromaticivorans]